MRRVELVAIINSFNRIELLKESLRSLTMALKESGLNAAIIVFDAGSADGSREFIETFPRDESLPVLCLGPEGEEGRSFSAGVNTAVEHALAEFPSTEWILLWETDNRIENMNAVPIAAGLLKKEKRLAGAGFTVEKDTGEKTGFGASFPTLVSFLAGRQISHALGLEKEKLREGDEINGVRWSTCDIVFTSPLLIKAAAWKEIGAFDEDNFPFAESDIDWCWRAASMGWRLAVLDLPGVVHDNRREQSSWSDKRAADFCRGRLRLFRKRYGTGIDLLKPLLFTRHCLEWGACFLAAPFLGQPGRTLKKRRELIKTVWRDYD